MFGLDNLLPLRGTVGLREGAPPVVALSFDFGDQRLTVVPQLSVERVACQVRTFDAALEDSTPETRLELVGTVNIGSTDPLLVRIRSPFYKETSVYSFTAQFDDHSMTISRGVAALVEFAGGSAEDFKLPDAIGALDVFYLSEFSCAVDPSASMVRHFGFTVASDQEWGIVGDLKVTGLSFGWLIMAPFSGQFRSVAATVSRILSFGTAHPIRFIVTASTQSHFT